MYKKLLNTAVLVSFSFGSLSLNLTFAKNDGGSGESKIKDKEKEKKLSLLTNIFRGRGWPLNIGSDLKITDPMVALFSSFFGKIAVSTVKDYFFHKNEGIELNSEKVNKETNKYVKDKVKRSNAGKTYEHKESELENKDVPTNEGIEKEKDILEKLDEENKEKQEIKGAEKSDITNPKEIKNENQENTDAPEQDTIKKEENLIGLKTKAFSIVILAMVGAIIFYKYLNRAVVEKVLADGKIIYKIKVNKATKEDIENIRKKAKAGDKIVLIFNFSKTDNAWQEISLKTGELLSTNTENTIPILNYDSADKLNKIHNKENLELNFDVLKDYGDIVNSYKGFLYSFEKFEETMSIINNVFGQLYHMPSNNYNLSFSHIFCLVNTSYLLDFTYLRDTQGKYDNFLNELLNKEEHYLKLEALTGFLYRDVLDKVEEKRKNKNKNNVNNSSRYKKISSAINIEDLIEFIDVIKDFNNDEYKIKELQNIKVNMNLVYTSLLEKIIIYIFTNGGTIAKRKLYQFEKYEIFKLLKVLRNCIGYFYSSEGKDKRLDDNVFNKLRDFLERFKNNTSKKQAPAKFDNLTVEELAEVYNEDYIKNKLDIFSGEFWELANHVRKMGFYLSEFSNKEEGRKLGKISDNLSNLVLKDSKIKISLGKLGSFNFEDLAYDKEEDTVFLKFDNRKISLHDFCSMLIEDVNLLNEAQAVLINLYFLIYHKKFQEVLIEKKTSKESVEKMLKHMECKIINGKINQEVGKYFLEQKEMLWQYFLQYQKANIEEIKEEAKKKKFKQGTQLWFDYVVNKVFEDKKKGIKEKDFIEEEEINTSSAIQT